MYLRQREIQDKPVCERRGCTNDYPAPYFAQGKFYCYPCYNGRDETVPKGIRLATPIRDGACLVHYEWLDADGNIRLHY